MTNAVNGALRLWLFVCAAVVSGCASYPLNEPIDTLDPSSGYRLDNIDVGPGNSDELFVILALSGGGTRAAALDYGVIQALDQVRFGADQRSLVDEVDVISSSSAASFVSSYIGLFGKEAFLADFPDKVLYRSIQSSMTRRVLNPLNWPRLMSGRFSRGDLFAEYFDAEIYGGRTFADMSPHRPIILLNATDIGIGSTFTFAQGNFDLLCSDLYSYNVARAVAASMAFTPGFTPITLKNYNDGRCGDTVPEWARQAIAAGVEAEPQVFAAASDLFSYQDVATRPYIHLLDSGIADNIGVRRTALAFKINDSPGSQISRVEDGSIKKLVFIIVNARPKSAFGPDLSPKPPGAVTSATASASRPLANYSFETVNLMRRDIDAVRDHIRLYHEQRNRCVAHAAAVCANRAPLENCVETVQSSCFEEFGVTDAARPPNLDIYLIHLNFELLDDEDRRTRFETIPTTLQLPREDVDALVGIAPELLREEPEFLQLVEDLGAAYNE